MSIRLPSLDARTSLQPTDLVYAEHHDGTDWRSRKMQFQHLAAQVRGNEVLVASAAELSAALAAATEGTVVRIQPGTYTVQALYYSSDVGAIAPQLYLKDKTNVTILGYGATLQADSYGNMLTIEGCTHITIRGLTLRGSTIGMDASTNIAAAINHRGSNEHTTIQDCAFIDIADQAISHCWDQLNRPSYYWTVQNCWFHNIGQTSHPGVGGGLADGAMVSGRPRRLIFTGNRSTGKNVFGVELDGGGASAPQNDSEMRNSVIANNVLEGMYWVAVLALGVGTTPVSNLVIANNHFAFHATDTKVITAGLVVLAGARNVVISGNQLSGPIQAEANRTYGVLIHNPIGDGQHPTTEHVLFAGNNVVGMAYGFGIAFSPGVAAVVQDVRISGNTFRDQGESNVNVCGKGVHVCGNSFYGAGRLAVYGPSAVRAYDPNEAKLVGFVMRDNVLYDGALTPTTTRLFRVSSTAVPKSTVNIGNNRIVRMSGNAPYEIPSGMPFSGNAVQLTDAATIATDALLGDLYRVILGGNRTLSNPINVADGQRITWELVQDATGNRTITLDTQFALGTDISAVVLSTAANKRDFLTAVFNASAAKWYVVDFKKGY